MIELEDKKLYLITAEIENNNNIYIYLTNAKDVNDFCIRKTDNTKEILKPLENEEEYNLAMKLYNENNK